MGRPMNCFDTSNCIYIYWAQMNRAHVVEYLAPKFDYTFTEVRKSRTENQPKLVLAKVILHSLVRVIFFLKG